MSFLTGTTYGRDHVFPKDELRTATPESFVRWLTLKAFGKVEIGPRDKAIRRASTIEMCKKAVSFFMPERKSVWSDRGQEGNPTRATEVSDLLRYIRQKEVRRDGVKSSAKRDLTPSEFCAALTILASKNSFQLKYRLTTMMKFQYHMIARADDLGHFEISDLRSHSNLQIQVFWSKNVMEERKCPDQILLGSMDPNYCILLSFSIYLENWFTNHNGHSSFFLFSDDIDAEHAPDRAKNTYSKNLRTHIFSNEAFLSATGLTATKDLGTHSLRKYPATFASRNDCSQNAIEVRGRWRRDTTRIVNTYINVKQEYLDAKVQAALCVGGPIRYKLVDGSGITDAWCKQYVCPGICKFYSKDKDLCNVLALPLLFACFDPELKSFIPENILNRITDAYSQIASLPLSVNPVKRVLLHVGKIGQSLQIDELIDYNLENNNNENNNTNNNNGYNIGWNDMARQRDSLNALMVQNLQMKQQLAADHVATVNVINNFNADINNKLKIMNDNIKRIAIQPPRMATPRQRIANIEAEADNIGRQLAEEEIRTRIKKAELSKCPRTLHELWMEYEFGTGGRKAAKDFTAAERGGKNKFKYCRRKIFWDIIKVHVAANVAANIAIDRVYTCYGKKLSVTKIIEKLQKDRPSGGHPNLQL
jgi:hypothetical protein